MKKLIQEFRIRFVQKVEAARMMRNDLRPFKRLFRHALQKQADEKGTGIQVVKKEIPQEPLTRDEQHETILASYYTSSDRG